MVQFLISNFFFGFLFCFTDEAASDVVASMGFYGCFEALEFSFACLCFIRILNYLHYSFQAEAVQIANTNKH